MSPGTRAVGHLLASGPAGPATLGDDTADAAPRRRHSAELYDAIWSLDLPRVDKVDPAAVRLVLLAIAKHTNPSRDGGQFRCCPSVETLAQLAAVSERQVQRVLARFVELGYIEVETPGVRAGRGRPARPGWWRLRPDRWPCRGQHGDVLQDVAIAEPGSMVASPRTRLLRDGGVPQDAERAMVASPGPPKPGKGLTRKTGVQQQQQQGAPLERLKAEDQPAAGHQVALPGMAASRLPAPGCPPQPPPSEVGDAQAAALVAALYRGLGADAASLTATMHRREVAIARQLAAAGATPAEANAYARWARRARPGKVDLRSYERDRVWWLARGQEHQSVALQVVNGRIPE